MFIGFHSGMCATVYSMVSAVRRSDGSGGKMYVPRDRNSLMMSFCVVPRSCARVGALALGGGDVQRQQPRRRGVDGHRGVHLRQRNARRRAPACRRCGEIGTPTLPTSPAAIGSSES